MAEQRVQIHTAHWPALSSHGGFETVANSQVQAMMHNHALTAQCFETVASPQVQAMMLNHALTAQCFETVANSQVQGMMPNHALMCKQ